jgi:hypothetical protein
MRSETFSTPGPVLLDLEIPAGEIEIDTSDTDETHVELESISGSDEFVDAARLDVVRRGDRYEVVVEVKTRHGISISLSRGPEIRLGGPDVRLRISCPRGSEVDARTKSAEIRARGEYGAFEVKTASGDIQLDEATGPTRIKSASGDFHVDRVGSSLDVQTVSGDVHAGSIAGDLHAHLISGDMYVRDARGSISTNTVSGDQSYEAVMQGRVELKAISGDVLVGIRRGSRVFVDANTVSGSTTSELELGDAPAPSAEPGATQQGPLVELFVKTVSGDVRIERAPAPMELSEQS